MDNVNNDLLEFVGKIKRSHIKKSRNKNLVCVIVVQICPRSSQGIRVIASDNLV